MACVVGAGKRIRLGIRAVGAQWGNASRAAHRVADCPLVPCVVMAADRAAPPTDASRKSPQPRAHQGQAGKGRGRVGRPCWNCAMTPLFQSRVEEAVFWIAIVVGFVLPFLYFIRWSRKNAAFTKTRPGKDVAGVT